jgi:hypothetical protein
MRTKHLFLDHEKLSIGHTIFEKYLDGWFCTDWKFQEQLEVLNSVKPRRISTQELLVSIKSFQEPEGFLSFELSVVKLAIRLESYNLLIFYTFKKTHIEQQTHKPEAGCW